jgi:hypothetical protein
VEAISFLDLHEARCYAGTRDLGYIPSDILMMRIVFDNYGSSSCGFDKLSAALYALVADTDAKVYDTNRAPYRNVAASMLRVGKAVALAN